MKDAAVIIGASSGLGKCLAYVLAENGIDLILSARSFRDLEAIASDLQIRYKIKTVVIPIDLEKADYTSNLEFVKNCFRRFHINQVYITAGTIDKEDYGSNSSKVLSKIMKINCLSIAEIVVLFSEKLLATKANITVISSIAAIRPRTRNPAYTSSKIALEYYLRSLQHFYKDTKLRIQIYRLGYMSTHMIEGQKLILPVAKPKKVAKYIFEGRDEGFNLRYYPRFWIVIAKVISIMPWMFFKKFEF